MTPGTSRPVRLLLIGDRRRQGAAVVSAAGHLGYAVVHHDPEPAGLAGVAEGDSFDAAIVAVGADRERALDVIGELAVQADCAVIALLDADDPDFLREAARRGVFAYLTGHDVAGDRFASTIDIARQRYAEYRGRDRVATRWDAHEHEQRIAPLERADEIAGIGSYAWDIQSGGLWWSDNVFRLFGLRPGAVTPTPESVIELVYADDREHVREVVETVARTGEFGMLEYRIRRADGALRRLQAVVAAVEQTDGVPGRLVGTVQDVTERRQNAPELAGTFALEDMSGVFARRTGEPNELTRRERQVLQFAAQGMSGKAIAHELTLSPSTVKTHFENIYAKWEVSDRASAVAKALREGLIR